MKTANVYVLEGIGISSTQHFCMMIIFECIAYNHRSGDQYYKDLCMKAVNQSVGRSIRHVRDYACILLIGTLSLLVWDACALSC